MAVFNIADHQYPVTDHICDDNCLDAYEEWLEQQDSSEGGADA